MYFETSFFVTGQGSSNQSEAITKTGATVNLANSRTITNITDESFEANSQQLNLNVLSATMAAYLKMGID